MEHFLYFISQLRFLIGMLNLCSIFLSVITLKWNREENGGGRGVGAGLQIDGGVHVYDCTGTAALVGG